MLLILLFLGFLNALLGVATILNLELVAQYYWNCFQYPKEFCKIFAILQIISGFFLFLQFNVGLYVVIFLYGGGSAVHLVRQKNIFESFPSMVVLFVAVMLLPNDLYLQGTISLLFGITAALVPKSNKIPLFDEKEIKKWKNQQHWSLFIVKNIIIRNQSDLK